MDYELSRAVHDKRLHVLNLEDRFDQLPDDVRRRGPWQVIRRGAVADLRPDYRLPLENGGHVVIETDIALLKIE